MMLPDYRHTGKVKGTPRSAQGVLDLTAIRGIVHYGRRLRRHDGRGNRDRNENQLSRKRQLGAYCRRAYGLVTTNEA